MLIRFITRCDKLKTLCGNIGDTFVAAPCIEKVYARTGVEFGDQKGCIIIIHKALYGLKSSARAFWLFLAGHLCGLGFKPTRYNRDVWIRLRDEKFDYNYMCTYVDDFKVIAKDTEKLNNGIAKKFQLKEVSEPKYYLGSNYNYSLDELT